MKRIKQLPVFILALILILSGFKLPVSATETDGTKIGWYKEKNEWYFYDERGEIVTGWASIGGNWYYFKSNGVMAANEWCDGYWLNANGSWTYQPRGSWKQNSTGWWFGDTSGWYAKNTTIKINDFPYSFNAAGYMKTGWQYYDGNWYYINPFGTIVTGWVKIGNDWYYMNSSGVMITGWASISGVWYFFKSSGSMAANEWYDGYWLNANGSWTYQPRGSWKQNSTGWWFGDTSGWYAKNTTIKIDDLPYSFNAAGYMKTGWQYFGGNWYYIDSSGSFAKGWKYINNHMYYFLSSGRMATGSIDMNEKTFFLDSNGALLPSLYDDLKSMAYNEIVLWITANANDTVSGNPAYTETYKEAEQTIYSDSTDGFICIERGYNTGTTKTAGAIYIWENDEYSFTYQEVYNPQTDDFDIWGNAYITDASFDLNYQIDFKLYEGDPELQQDTENKCSESCYNSLLWLNHITDRECLDINCTTLGFYSMTY